MKENRYWKATQSPLMQGPLKIPGPHSSALPIIPGLHLLHASHLLDFLV